MTLNIKVHFHLMNNFENFELFRLTAVKNFFVSVEPLDKDNNFTMQGGALSVIGATNRAGLMGLTLITKLCETK